MKINYNTSKNYRKLQKLLDEGYDVVCFTKYSHADSLGKFQICDVCYAYKTEDKYYIISPGMCYGIYQPQSQRFKSFAQMCKNLKISYIMPDKEIPKKKTAQNG